MPYSAIIYNKRQTFAVITLNRPAVDNVINQQLAQEIGDICREVDQDGEVRVVIITGAGDGAFCGGSELAVPSGVAAAAASLQKPVMAAISGDALGQGLELALSCDIRLAIKGAKLGFPQVAAGIIPMDGGTQRLARIVGRGKALEMLFTGETITAEEAYNIGLVKAPIALRYIKETVNKGLDLTLEQGFRLEADLYFLLHTTSDRTEGIRAFQEKRSPEFKGQ
jgi:enoyl-CoA hydratase